MKAWQVGSLALWAVVIGLMGVWPSPKALAQEAHTQVSAAPSGMAAQGAERVLPAQGLLPAANSVRLAAMQDEIDDPREPLAVVYPAHDSGFERLRRALPYGVTHEPVIRFLTDEQPYVTEDN